MRKPIVFTEEQDLTTVGKPAGTWRWVATRNGLVVAWASGYSTQSNARRAHRALRKGIVAGADIEAHR